MCVLGGSAKYYYATDTLSVLVLKYSRQMLANESRRKSRLRLLRIIRMIWIVKCSKQNSEGQCGSSDHSYDHDRAQTRRIPSTNTTNMTSGGDCWPLRTRPNAEVRNVSGRWAIDITQVSDQIIGDDRTKTFHQ